MKNIRYLLFVLLFPQFLVAQCEYDLLNYTHIDCYGDTTGTIEIIIPNAHAAFWWTGPFGFSSTSLSLSDLLSGDYVLTIQDTLYNPLDTSFILVCAITDTIKIEQTIDIQADFTLYNMCLKEDSADIATIIWGGTPPYTTLWSTGDTSRNPINLPPSLLPFVLTITDANNCHKDQSLTIDETEPMQSFMSAEFVFCKDDNSGSARVFVSEGTPPFSFWWSTDTTLLIEHDSFSVINNLYPGEYTVTIEDAQGCTRRDSIVVATNPDACLKVHKVFSPNEDGINDYWEIENIHLYENALVEVYSKSGRRIFRRRNYKNALKKNDIEGIIAFGGQDDEGNRIPSATYYYIINLENEEKVFKGTETIVR